MQKITVSIESVYGRNLVYPACETSQLFCDLIGAKSFTPSQLRIIKVLGYEVQVKAKELDL
jgi:hypothetical protein